MQKTWRSHVLTAYALVILAFLYLPLVILALYILGGPVNRDFALALLIGIGFGTLSSIFISAPALLFFSKPGDTTDTAAGAGAPAATGA